MLNENFSVVRQFTGVVVILFSTLYFVLTTLGYFYDIPYVPRYSVGFLPITLLLIVITHQWIMSRKISKMLK